MRPTGRLLRASFLLGAVSLALCFLAAPTQAADDPKIVCVEVPYNGPPLPDGVQIGTALRCEKLTAEPLQQAVGSDSQNAPTSTAHTSTPTGGPGVVLLASALLLPLAAKLGWSFISRRHAAGVPRIATD